MPPETPTRKRNMVRPSSLEHDHHGFNDINHATNINMLYGHGSPPLTSQSSITSPENLGASTSQSLLAPPNFYPRERRLSSSSSFDSSVSQSSRRRLRRNSSRLSDLEDGKNEITLLTFARAAQKVCNKIGRGLRRAVSTLFVSRPRKPNLVLDADVIEQAKWICSDYIVTKLSSRQLMNRRVGLIAPCWPKSLHLINAGFNLEATYPRTYSNVSRKLLMTMSSQKVVRTTLTLLLEVLFEQEITWGKIVSMFAVAGLFAEECASQGHADFVKEVVDAITDFTSSHLVTWLASQGGWDAFPIPGGNERSRLSKMRLCILVCGTSFILYSGFKFADMW